MVAFLSKQIKISGRKAVLMGDVNARNKKWDKAINNRGNPLLSRAIKYGWQITVPSELMGTSENRLRCIVRQ